MIFLFFCGIIIIYNIQFYKERKVITTMGTLANVRDNLKESKIGLMLRDAYGALLAMVNSEGYEEQTVEEAIQATIKENPEMGKDLKKFGEIEPISEKSLEEKVRKQFDTSETFGIELNGKDEDGYNKIPNKVGNIEAKVSEEEALKQKSERQKDGRQKTRVDED